MTIPNTPLPPSTAKRFWGLQQRWRHYYPNLDWYGNSPIEPTGAGLTYAESITEVRHMLHHLADRMDFLDDYVKALCDELVDFENDLKDEVSNLVTDSIDDIYALLDLVIDDNNKTPVFLKRSERGGASVNAYSRYPKFTDQYSLLIERESATTIHISGQATSETSATTFGRDVTISSSDNKRVWTTGNYTVSTGQLNNFSFYYVSGESICETTVTPFTTDAPTTTTISCNHTPGWITFVGKSDSGSDIILEYLSTDYKLYQINLTTGAETLIYIVPSDKISIFDPIKDVLSDGKTLRVVNYQSGVSGVPNVSTIQGLAYTECFDGKNHYQVGDYIDDLTLANASGVTLMNTTEHPHRRWQFVNNVSNYNFDIYQASNDDLARMQGNYFEDIKSKVFQDAFSDDYNDFTGFFSYTTAISNVPGLSAVATNAEYCYLRRIRFNNIYLMIASVFDSSSGTSTKDLDATVYTRYGLISVGKRHTVSWAAWESTAVADLKDRVSTLEDKIDDIEDKLNDLENRVDEIEKIVDALKPIADLIPSLQDARMVVLDNLWSGTTDIGSTVTLAKPKNSYDYLDIYASMGSSDLYYRLRASQSVLGLSADNSVDNTNTSYYHTFFGEIHLDFGSSQKTGTINFSTSVEDYVPRSSGHLWKVSKAYRSDSSDAPNTYTTMSVRADDASTLTVDTTSTFSAPIQIVKIVGVKQVKLT